MPLLVTWHLKPTMPRKLQAMRLQRRQLINRRDELWSRLAQDESYMQNCRLLCQGTVYPGVEISIGRAFMVVDKIYKCTLLPALWITKLFQNQCSPPRRALNDDAASYAVLYGGLFPPYQHTGTIGPKTIRYASQRFYYCARCHAQLRCLLKHPAKTPQDAPADVEVRLGDRVFRMLHPGGAERETAVVDGQKQERKATVCQCCWVVVLATPFGHVLHNTNGPVAAGKKKPTCKPSPMCCKTCPQSRRSA